LNRCATYIEPGAQYYVKSGVQYKINIPNTYAYFIQSPAKVDDKTTNVYYSFRMQIVSSIRISLYANVTRFPCNYL